MMFGESCPAKAAPLHRVKVVSCQWSEEAMCPQAGNWDLEMNLWHPSPGLTSRRAAVQVVMAPGGGCQGDATTWLIL